MLKDHKLMRTGSPNLLTMILSALLDKGGMVGTKTLKKSDAQLWAEDIMKV